MRPFDVSKFRKSVVKSIDGISIGFDDPSVWLNSGNFALNYLMSSDFFKGIPLSKFSIFAGSPGAGKSYIASGNLVRHAQSMGVFCLLLDSENALDESWLQKLGVDTSEEKLLKLSVTTIDETAKTINEFVKGYRESYGELPKEEKPHVLIIIDSLSMLMGTIENSQMEAGELKGSIGGNARALKALVKGTLNRIAGLPIGVVATNHTYAAPDQYSDATISGGSGPLFCASIVTLLNPLKLKEDEDGNKTTDVLGIRSSIKVMKSRYAKPFEKVEVKIPYETGMDPYSGLFDLFEKKGVLVKDGNRYVYTSTKNPQNSFKEFRKNITDDQYMAIMKEWEEPKLYSHEAEVEEEETEEVA